MSELFSLYIPTHTSESILHVQAVAAEISKAIGSNVCSAAQLVDLYGLAILRTGAMVSPPWRPFLFIVFLWLFFVFFPERLASILMMKGSVGFSWRGQEKYQYGVLLDRSRMLP